MDGMLERPMTWWESDASYAPLGQRMPLGFPLKPVIYGTLRESDLRPGSLWTPARVQGRRTRLARQTEAARGDFRAFVSDPTGDSVAFAVPWWASFERTLAAVLLSNEPTGSADDAALARALAGAIRDMLRHGVALLVGINGEVTQRSINAAWPLDDGSWVATSPVQLGDGPTVDGIELTHLTPGLMAVQVWEAQGRVLGEPVGQVVTTPADWAVASLDAEDGHWPTPLLDEVLPILTVASLIYTDIRWSLSGFARPYEQHGYTDAQLVETLSNAPDAFGAPAFATGQELSESDRTRALQFKNNRPAVRIEDGLEAKVIETPVAMQGSHAMLDRLRSDFEEAVGLSSEPMPEAGGEISGIAVIASRYLRVIMRARELFAPLRQAADVALGGGLGWELPAAPETGPAPTVEDANA